MAKRKIDLLVISDVHLGTYGCHARELANYLKSVDPGKIIPNGDIIDGWQFSKNFWPQTHSEVLKIIVDFMASGTPVYYLTGNHDEILRKFSGFQLSNFHLVDKLVIEENGEKFWFFHGDIFDLSVNYAKWIAKIGGYSYDYLILLNRWINLILEKMGKEKVSISKKIKNSIKSAVKFSNDYEKIAIDHAIDQGYDYVICGHIHQPCMRTFESEKGKVTYLNSGDWVENLTSLEYTDGKWSLFYYPTEIPNTTIKPIGELGLLNGKALKVA
ncbi:MAG: UDP-2,3-diacylglucosamine diphosphatase [Bacteroidia bacterium]|nr:UDP-2,3-diacylglucosamine diphosphatase [Bacteroidia bacterium]